MLEKLKFLDLSFSNFPVILDLKSLRSLQVLKIYRHSLFNIHIKFPQYKDRKIIVKSFDYLNSQCDCIQYQIEREKHQMEFDRRNNFVYLIHEKDRKNIDIMTFDNQSHNLLKTKRIRKKYTTIEELNIISRYKKDKLINIKKYWGQHEKICREVKYKWAKGKNFANEMIPVKVLKESKRYYLNGKLKSHKIFKYKGFYKNIKRKIYHMEYDEQGKIIIIKPPQVPPKDAYIWKYGRKYRRKNFLAWWSWKFRYGGVRTKTGHPKNRSRKPSWGNINVLFMDCFIWRRDSHRVIFFMDHSMQNNYYLWKIKNIFPFTKFWNIFQPRRHNH